MVKKVITILDSSKVSGPNCIPVVVELSYILAELFNVSEGLLFFKLFEDLIGSSCI